MSARESQAPGGSAKARARVSKCPICGKPQIEHSRPFCSKHCADIDLGRWLEGRYAVPGEPASPDAAEEDQD